MFGAGATAPFESGLDGVRPSVASGSSGGDCAGAGAVVAPGPAGFAAFGVIRASSCVRPVNTAARRTARKTEARPVSPIRTRWLPAFCLALSTAC